MKSGADKFNTSVSSVTAPTLKLKDKQKVPKTGVDKNKIHKILKRELDNVTSEFQELRQIVSNMAK